VGLPPSSDRKGGNTNNNPPLSSLMVNDTFFTTTRKMLTPLTNTTKTDTMTPAMIPACESLQSIKDTKNVDIKFMDNLGVTLDKLGVTLDNLGYP
jgi:hypothetical protein